MPALDHVLPLGTVVMLEGGDVLLMVIARGQLFDNDGALGYFDYAACIYPEGVTPERPALFFNDENIDRVLFEGYRDDGEIVFAKTYYTQVATCPYPKLSLS